MSTITKSVQTCDGCGHTRTIPLPFSDLDDWTYISVRVGGKIGPGGASSIKSIELCPECGALVRRDLGSLGC